MLSAYKSLQENEGDLILSMFSLGVKSGISEASTCIIFPQMSHLPQANPIEMEMLFLATM